MPVSRDVVDDVFEERRRRQQQKEKYLKKKREWTRRRIPGRRFRGAIYLKMWCAEFSRDFQCGSSSRCARRRRRRRRRRRNSLSWVLSRLRSHSEPVAENAILVFLASRS
jgi:hypothetical protein